MSSTCWSDSCSVDSASCRKKAVTDSRNFWKVLLEFWFWSVRSHLGALCLGPVTLPGVFIKPLQLLSHVGMETSWRQRTWGHEDRREDRRTDPGRVPNPPIC